MEKASLEEIQEYCKDKRIVIVGNSSSILQSCKGKFIDSHDIVVRMNYAYPVKPSHVGSVGRKTDIYLAGISRPRIIEGLLLRNNLKFILRLTPWGDPIQLNKVHYTDKESYSKLNLKFGEFKPSSGCLAINFFKENIDYQLLNIIGFDFFTTADTVRKNEFKSYKYKDHDISLEKKFIISCLNSKTKLVKT